MDTPFQWTKQVASHFGGTRNPMIVSWPARIKDKGGLRSQFHPRHRHRADASTRLIGITAPTDLNGVPQKPIEGISFAYTFDDAKAKGRRTTQYFELGCNRGIYHDGWMASASSFAPWDPNREGFDPDKAEVGTLQYRRGLLAGERPRGRESEKLRELQDLWWVEAAKYNVLPLDWRGVERLNAELMGRPSLIGRPQDVDLLPRAVGLPDAAAPRSPQQVVDDHRRHRVPEDGDERA